MAETDIYILITRFLEGNISKSENDYLQDWLLHKENKMFFEEVKRTWELSKKAGHSLKTDIDSEWQKFKEIRDNQRSLNITKKIFLPQRVFAVAAGILVIVGLFFTYKYLVNNTETNKIAFTSDETVLQKELNDGSKVWLNKHSSIQYSEINKNERKVLLKGEAYFEVSKDSSKPFIVIAGNTQTKVLGTQFNIRALPGGDSVEMTVVEGRVQFSNENQKMEFTKGEQGIAIRSTGELIKRENIEMALAWKDSSLIFVNKKVEKVIKELEHHFKVKISYPADIADLNFTAEFKHPKLSEVISVFSISFNLNYKIENNKVYLTKK